ncbi:MAG: acetate--CoA ligase [Firmicutes bacterium]|nr:acetate--CoA ligase [Alicyclobacillaceae bacterium]MCL6496029.1 acetate--CoA ligase [Bacillota bacterium]
MASSEPGQRELEALLQETRRFPPDPTFARTANARDPAIYEWARRDPEGYWAEQARRLAWFRPFEQVLRWEEPHAQWFLGGQLNAAYNCVDRHAEGERRNKAAIIWEGEPGDQRILTYGQLQREVARCANGLKRLGVRAGDRVTIYMGMIPQLPIAMLACARIGAVHSVVFGGFSAEALRDRINDARSEVVLTADGGWRRGSVVPLKAQVDLALEGAPSVKHVVVVRRVGEAAGARFSPGRDRDWEEWLAAESAVCDPEPMDSEAPLFILYTSGTTGKPKGIVHSTGGYLTGVETTCRLVFDLKERDVYWCAADIGWVTGHSYVVYGPLANGATVVMYEGAPDFPDRGRNWQIIERYGVNIFYTAPTAIRAHMRWGPEWPARYDLSSLRLLGSVGEPINPEAWMWYWEHIGGKRTPIVDTWWQTETGAIMIAPLPGLTETKPGSATRPLPGIEAEVVDQQGRPVPPGAGGFLVLTRPWPSMLRTIWGDDRRYRETYWSRFPGRYFTGDGARRDEDGYFWLLGRVDDVINVSGHRIGTMEVESALVDHPAVAEAAVIGRHDDLKGQAIAAFVTLKEGVAVEDGLKEALRRHVAGKIGAIARPDDVFFAAELPKTRSGKIMRRLLRDIAEGRALGDTTTLADPAVVEALKAQYQEEA